MESTADQAPQADIQSVSPVRKVFRCVSTKRVYLRVHSKVCWRFSRPHVSPRDRKVTNAPTQSSRSLHSLRGHLVLGAQCPVASQWAVLSVIPAHEPDSHHKAPIVFAGWIGSHSACHSTATCITRRHSGACFCFCFLLSCQPHRATLFCLRAYLTLIWEGFFLFIFFYQNSLLRSDSTPLQLIYAKTIVAKYLLWLCLMGSHGPLCLFTWVNLFVRDSEGLHVPESSRGRHIICKRQSISVPAGLWANRLIENQSENGIHSRRPL